MGTGQLERKIGLVGASATLVGYVVGASIFVLPGVLAATTGPAVFLAFLLGSIPALLSCFVTAQIGCVYPVSGASFVAASRNLSPLWGFMLVWSLMMGVTVGVALIAYSFADYLLFFFPDSNRRLVAVVTVAFFAVLNLRGARISVGTQAVMVSCFLGALFLFGTAGLGHIDAANFRPLMANGFGSVAQAAIPAYFSFIGFTMLADLAGEIESPANNIPRALALSFTCVLFFYTLVPVVLVGVVPWRELEGMPAAVATASTRFLPGYLSSFISVGALFAAATSINGIILAVSRDVYALAQDKIFPESLGRVDEKINSPTAAILTISTLAFLGVLPGATITEYAVVAVTAIMVVQIVSAAAVLVLPWRSPARFEQSAFRLSSSWRIFCSIGLILYSLTFIVLGTMQSRVSGMIFMGLIVIGVAYYLMRKRFLRRQGLTIEQALRKDAMLASATD